MSEPLVVIGNGMAATRFVDELSKGASLPGVIILASKTQNTHQTCEGIRLSVSEYDQEKVDYESSDRLGGKILKLLFIAEWYGSTLKLSHHEFRI